MTNMPEGGNPMEIRSTFSRFLRASKRSLAIALAGLVLTATFLPASSSAQAVDDGWQIVLPEDGVGDSPLVP
jgi:hypothetical protein